MKILDKLMVVASEGSKGLNDEVSSVFARSPFFTLVRLERGAIKDVKVEANTAAKLAHGVGPIVSMRLIKRGVNTVIAGQFGPTTSEMLKEAGVATHTVPVGTKIRDAVQRLSRI